MTDVREKFMTGPLDLVIRVGDTFGEVCCIDLANDPLVTFFFAVFANKQVESGRGGRPRRPRNHACNTLATASP